LRVLFIKPKIKLIFLESFCRVQHLSLTGRILYPIVNLFIVHWPQLTQQYPNAKYIGIIL
jgi:beta-1,4-N-acetylglucosaminyltransferase